MDKNNEVMVIVLSIGDRKMHVPMDYGYGVRVIRKLEKAEITVEWENGKGKALVQIIPQNVNGVLDVLGQMDRRSYEWLVTASKLMK